jgi:ABC-type uncharacterized transport system substrate-binding protein
MRRRAFLAMLGVAAAACPLTTLAQQTTKIPRIGVLWHAGNEQQEAIFLGALRKGLNELGYVEGKNIELVNRFADEHYDRFDGLAAELVKAKVDVIVGSISSAAIAAKRQTASIPIIFVASGDPMGMGLADTLARPGGNVTGTSNLFVDMAAKNLELLKDCFSNLSAVEVFGNSNSPILRSYVSAGVHWHHQKGIRRVASSAAPSGHPSALSCCPLLGVKRTSQFKSIMSAFDRFRRALV